jgi:hypothetical protein
MVHDDVTAAFAAARAAGDRQRAELTRRVVMHDALADRASRRDFRARLAGLPRVVRLGAGDDGDLYLTRDGFAVKRGSMMVPFAQYLLDTEGRYAPFESLTRTDERGRPRPLELDEVLDRVEAALE